MPGLNPQIQSMEIGVKALRTVTFYPLSMADQFTLSDIITAAVEEYGSVEESSDVDIFKTIMSAIQDNLIVILNLITDDNEDVTLNELTNNQFADICEMIYSVNFESASGKFKSLFNKAKKAFQLKRPSQASSLQQVTDLNISSDSHSEMGE